MDTAEYLGWITNLLYALGLMPAIQAFVVIAGVFTFMGWLMGRRGD